MRNDVHRDVLSWVQASAQGPRLVPPSCPCCRQMVKECHRRGIEVILDVVFNHTAEGNEMGPTLSFR